MKLLKKRHSGERGYLDGQFLVAMPNMTDKRFARSVVYMCAHTSEGSMGIIVNHPAENMSFPELLVQLSVVEERQSIRLPERASEISVLRGGPVESGRGFVLHSADFTIGSATMAIDTGICLTTTVDILRAIAKGKGPDRALLALGYAGWSGGQIEAEIERNDWLQCPAQQDIIFDGALETKYDRALSLIGVDPRRLSSTAGHA